MTIVVGMNPSIKSREMEPKTPFVAIIAAVEEEAVEHQGVHPQDKVTTMGVMGVNLSKLVTTNIKTPQSRHAGTAIFMDTI
jgi:hypothetical protein